MAFKKIIFDLMDTLVYFDKEVISDYIMNINTQKKETETWVEAGFMQALIAEDLNIDYAELRDYHLVNDYYCVDSFIESSCNLTEKGIISDNIFNKSKELINIVLENTYIYPETINVLDYLYENKYELYLITNLISPYKKIVEKLDLDKYFKEVFYSCEKGYKKPEIGRAHV